MGGTKQVCHIHHHSCPSISRISLSNHALPMPGTADGDAVDRYQILGRAGSGSIMGQTSRCCMVCLMPQSHVSVTFVYAHLRMFTFDRPTCVRNRGSAFRVFPRLSAPGGRCSSELTLRCTVISLLCVSSTCSCCPVVINQESPSSFELDNGLS